MSKIICDVCGTSYPETATQCPICGCVRPGEAQRVNNGASGEGNVSGGYTYVKGGRFSKSNVKKRMKANTSVKTPAKTSNTQKTNQSTEKSNRGLVITAIVLLLAIVAVVIYIVLRYFAPFAPLDDVKNPEDNKQNIGTENENEDEKNNVNDGKEENEKPQEIPCVSLKLDLKGITFEKTGAEKLINATIAPTDTTDVITFSSSNNAVATVSTNGKVVAVGEGSAVITVSCGDLTAECMVTCKFEEEKPVNTEEFRLNRTDITFGAKGDSWVLYSGTVSNTLITWSSDDESVATFENGKVVAVGPGTIEVHAEYNEQQVSCIIRCDFSEESSGIGGNGGGITEDGGVTEDGGITEDDGITEDGSITEDDGSTEDGSINENDGSSVESSGTYAIYSQYGDPVSDVTIAMDQTVQLTLRDAAGNVVDVSWSLSGSGCSVSGNTITGLVAGSFTIASATYNGITYSCDVHVSE